MRVRRISSGASARKKEEKRTHYEQHDKETLGRPERRPLDPRYGFAPCHFAASDEPPHGCRGLRQYGIRRDRGASLHRTEERGRGRIPRHAFSLHSYGCRKNDISSPAAQQLHLRPAFLPARRNYPWLRSQETLRGSQRGVPRGHLRAGGGAATRGGSRPRRKTGRSPR